MNIRKLLAVGSAAVLLTFAGCAYTPTSGVEQGDGPATSATEPATSTSTSAGEDQDQATDEPTEDVTPVEEGPKTADFEQKYVYEDGVEVEVIKISHGKVSRADAEWSEPEAKAGDDYVLMTVRVRNGSKATLDAYSSFTVTYGPDGTEAKRPYIPSKTSATETMSGKILPGRSKTATDLIAIPSKYQGDPVLEFSFDFEHEPAIFAGSVKS